MRLKKQSETQAALEVKDGEPGTHVEQKTEQYIYLQDFPRTVEDL